MRTGTADTVCTMMQTTFFDAAEPPQLDSEQQLLLFTLLLNVRREIFAEQLGEEPARDTACFDLFNAYLRSGAATQLEMLHRFTDLCAETCRQREENERRRKQQPLPLCERLPFFSHVPTSPLARFRPCRFSLSYSPASAASASQRSISSVSFCSCASFSV